MTFDVCTNRRIFFFFLHTIHNGRLYTGLDEIHRGFLLEVSKHLLDLSVPEPVRFPTSPVLQTLLTPDL